MVSDPRDGLMVDNMEAQTRLLQQLVSMMAEKEFAGDDNVDISGTQAAGHTLIDPRSWVVKETDDLDGVDAGAAMTLSPGETKTLVEAQPTSDAGLLLLAAGATDANDVQYRLKLDDKFVIGGATNSPLGVLNSPFSFPESLGGAIPVEKYIEYEVQYDANASGDIDLAARLHVQMLK